MFYKKIMPARIPLRVYSGYILKLDRNTELAQSVDVMMARAKRIYILIVKVNELFSFFSSRCFPKEIENMFFVKVWKNSKKLWKHSPIGSCSHSISRSPKRPLVFLLNNQITSSRFLSRDS